MLVSFIAGASGEWDITRIDAVIGRPLEPASRLAVVQDPSAFLAPGVWSLRGTASNIRYATRDELSVLAARQEGLGRPEATRAALIPIRKNAEWWSLAQDERRSILGERSHHIGIGLDYLPAIYRRLLHGRDLGEHFDFLTWFEYAPEHETRFEDLVGELRKTEEWRYVEHEVDVRLRRGAQP